MEPEEFSSLLSFLQTSRNAENPPITELSEVLKKLTDMMKYKIKRQEMTELYWKCLLDVGEIGRVILQKQSTSNEEMDFITSFLRCLRNSCAGCCEDDQLILSSKEFLKIPMQILLLLGSRRSNASDEDVIAMRCCLQIFGNVVCQSITSKDIVWQSFNHINLFRNLLLDPDSKLQEYIMMVLYHCMKPKSENYLLSDKGWNIFLTLTNVLSDNLNDWGLLILESVVCEVQFFEKYYTLLPLRSRLLILDVIAELLENENDSLGIPETSLKAIKNMFVENVLDIVKTSDLNYDDLKPIELTKLLSVLCITSVAYKYGQTIKTFPDLLETSIDALKCVHLLGKQSCNAFSTITKLSESPKLTKEELESHPTYCFKKNLVRLIGNMCSGNRFNQDLVRKYDGIPLLFDCCNIDIRNPYIMQWCILAIRNILENNHDNQAVLASVSVTEELIDSPLLDELGLMVLRLENGELSLKHKSQTLPN